MSYIVFVLVSLYKISLKIYFPPTNSANMVVCELSELRTERRNLYFVKQAMCNLSCGRNDEVFWDVTDRRTWLDVNLKVLATDSPETRGI